jgi:cell division protein FtsQ
VRELAAALPRTLAAFPGRIASRTIRLSPTPRMRRRLLAAAMATVALGALYQLWLRDSSIVAVSDVQVSGLTTKDGPRIRATLASVAEDMTTLHIRVDELEATARQFPVIGSIAVERDFPHGLRIEIAERRPAGLVPVGGVPLPVAADGTVLHGVQPPDGLPLLRTDKPVTDGRVTDARTLRALVVAGAAPSPLPERIERVSEGPARGIVVQLEDGPEIVFGDADHAAAKWAAAARVLADAEAEGASYVDVRLPERPVAGGLPVETIEPVAPAGEPVAPLPTPEAAVPADPAAAPPPDPAAAAPVAPGAVPAPTAAPAPAPAPAPTPGPTAPAMPQP